MHEKQDVWNALLRAPWYAVAAFLWLIFSLVYLGITT